MSELWNVGWSLALCLHIPIGAKVLDYLLFHTKDCLEVQLNAHVTQEAVRDDVLHKVDMFLPLEKGVVSGLVAVQVGQMVGKMLGRFKILCINKRRLGHLICSKHYKSSTLNFEDT